tara:strand:+ start:333 stop:491 length:159 start_codon:yes stop_codon:yes gene_type:complete
MTFESSFLRYFYPNITKERYGQREKEADRDIKILLKNYENLVINTFLLKRAN